MRWMVGIDIRNTSAGAVAVARSLARRSGTHELVAAHVIEDHARAALAAHDPEAAVALGRHVEALLQPLSDDDAFADVGSIPASAAEDGLEAGATERECDGFIIGRHAPAQGAALVRLGRVARRMLRTLSRPVIVVPPDMATDDVGAGPVFLATDLGPESSGAAQLARLLARTLGTDMLVTTVVPTPSEIQHYLHPVHGVGDRDHRQQREVGLVHQSDRLARPAHGTQQPHERQAGGEQRHQHRLRVPKGDPQHERDDEHDERTQSDLVRDRQLEERRPHRGHAGRGQP